MGENGETDKNQNLVKLAHDIERYPFLHHFIAIFNNNKRLYIC